MSYIRSIIGDHFIDIAMLAGHAYIMSSNKSTLDKMNTLFLGGLVIIKGLELGIVIGILHDYDRFMENLPTYGREFGQALIHTAQQYEAQHGQQHRQPIPPAYEAHDGSSESETSEEHEHEE